ncbi:sensor domain-containing diguanylate cyclase [Roseospira goensis]|uniref:Diguanylate cyclase (GGDEF)-like protein/PAS domain S-box-containing protein n=1 Tax=Roseospira goensis TaxID=391922 RepID=A0A7W6WJT4_9PROT|nr:PAS domain S-box protein [Roseospira goensis]MBB4285375.1 diguanylate cyclase (GGDEF)-like protein/PAS domain S-box-containing protein [Roseospira goensis]
MQRRHKGQTREQRRLPDDTTDAGFWQSFTLLSAALDATSDVIAIKDDALVVRFANAAFCRAVSRPLEDVLGRTDADLFPAETADALQGDDRTVLATGRSITRDQLIPSRRGLLWVNARTDPVIRAGRRIGVMTVIRDISDRIETERDLRRSTGLLDRFFSQSVFAVAYLDRRFNFLRVNEAYARAGRRQPGDFIGRNHFDLYPDPENEAIFRTVLRTGEPFAASARPFPHPDQPERGTTYWDVSVQPVRDAAGVIDGLILSLVDVTERQRAQQALRDSEARYRNLAEDQAAPIIKVDAENRLRYANPAFCALFGRRRETLIGEPFDHLVHEDDRAAARAGLARLAEPPHNATIELRAATAEGWRWLAWQATGVLDMDGRLVEVIGVGRDVTQRRETEAALSESERRYRLLAENATDLISTHDLQGRRTFVSPACRTLLGYDPDDLLGEGPTDLCHPDDIPRLLDVQARIASDDVVGHLRYRLRHKDGHEIWVESTSRAIRDPVTDAVTGLIAVTRDVTEQVREEESLRRSRLLYKGLFDGSSAPMLLVDPEDGRIVQANAAAAAFYGYPVATLRRMAVQDINIAPPEEVAALRARANSATQSRFEVRHRLASGEVRDILAHSTPLSLDGRRVLFTIIHDVTGRVRAEQALMEREATLRALFESTEDLICVRDPKGGLLTFNTAFRVFADRYFRVTAAPGLRTMDLLPPPERDHWETVLSHVLDGAVYREQFPVTFNGRPHWYDMALTPVVQDGRTLGTAEISRDITELKTAETAWARSEREKALILGSISDMVTFYNEPDMAITWTNAASAASLGVDMEDLIGKTCHALWAGRDAPCDGCPVLDCFRTRAPADGQMTTPDGRIWSIRAFPAFDDTGAMKGVVEIARDVSALVLSERKFETAFMNNATLMAITAPDSGRIRDANTAFLRTLGLERDAVIGRSLVELGLFPTEAIREHVLRHLLDPDTAGPDEVRFTAGDGTRVIGEMTAERIETGSGSPTMLLLMISDVTHQRDLMEQLEHKATHDVLTGAFNRQQADRILDQEARRADRMGTDVSLIMADVDHFKAINDSHGHPVGDTVLREVVTRLSDRIRETDLLARWGGEEFLVILPGTDRDGAGRLAETLRRAMADGPVPRVGRVTISLGVASRRAGESVADWVVRVDDALYEAKESGRNRVCLA